MFNYLINTSTNEVVGKFESTTDAELAGELLLGTEPYDVQDEETLSSPKSAYTKAILRAMLLSVGGGEMHPKATRPEILKKFLEVASQKEFAPIEPPKPEPVKKERAPREAGKVGVKTALRQALEAGETVCEEAWIASGYTQSNFRTAISDLRSAKYCGKDLLPLTIVREGNCYKLA